MDENQFKDLFYKHYKELCGRAYQMTRDADAAEDIVQETFVKVWNKREELEQVQSFRAYMFRAVTNATLNYLKVSKRTNTLDEEIKEVREYGASEVEEKYEGKELEKIIEDAINALPEKCRMVFILSRYEGMKYSEIAEEMEISVKTVENQMGKALERLRTALNMYLPGGLSVLIGAVITWLG